MKQEFLGETNRLKNQAHFSQKNDSRSYDCVLVDDEKLFVVNHSCNYPEGLERLQKFVQETNVQKFYKFYPATKLQNITFDMKRIGHWVFIKEHTDTTREVFIYEQSVYGYAKLFTLVFTDYFMNLESVEKFLKVKESENYYS